ncbi:RraA family protein [Falsiroseomonas ponticola]|uniref:RraA family protein n=1 Tax=Falsiroseomonas ponticola TaxID=2786951 RepID=UPI001932E960|nr:RraA family protein [Roseomonas ponticola]
MPEQDSFAVLAGFDTPTICNALDLLRPGRQGVSFTTGRLVWARDDEPAMIGIAVTATVRADEPPVWDAAEGAARRLGYWRHLAASPRPALLVAQDVSVRRGFGGIWGDVNAGIHQGLGLRGVVTDGAVRDLPLLPPGFGLLAGIVTPSHGHGHVAGWGEPVDILGMRVAPGDIVHADRHGAVAFPPALLPDLPAAARRVQAKEALLLAAARDGATPESLAAAFAAAARI